MRRRTFVMTVASLISTSCLAATEMAGRSETARTLSAPVWSPGEEWSWRWTREGGSGSLSSSVAPDEDADGERCYTLVGSNEKVWRRKTDLAQVRAELDRARRPYVERWLPPLPLYSWPLFVGKSWEGRYVFFRGRDTWDREITFNVVADEAVRVPAGNFRAMKVLQRRKPVGDEVAYWYAPEVKHEIKVTFRPGGRTGLLTPDVRERELIAYRVRPS
jgi:hypothetical protein